MARKTMMMLELEKCLDVLAVNPDWMIDATRHLLGLYGKLAWMAELSTSKSHSGDDHRSALQLYDTLMNSGIAPALTANIGAKSLCDVMRQVLGSIRHYPQNGEQYHYILQAAYFDPTPQSDVVLMDMLHLERTTFYTRKREAVTLFGTLLHTKYMPQLHQLPH